MHFEWEMPFWNYSKLIFEQAYILGCWEGGRHFYKEPHYLSLLLPLLCNWPWHGAGSASAPASAVLLLEKAFRGHGLIQLKLALSCDVEIEQKYLLTLILLWKGNELYWFDEFFWPEPDGEHLLWIYVVVSQRFLR